MVEIHNPSRNQRPLCVERNSFLFSLFCGRVLLPGPRTSIVTFLGHLSTTVAVPRTSIVTFIVRRQRSRKRSCHWLMESGHEVTQQREWVFVPIRVDIARHILAPCSYVENIQQSSEQHRNEHPQANMATCRQAPPEICTKYHANKTTCRHAPPGGHKMWPGEKKTSAKRRQQPTALNVGKAANCRTCKDAGTGWTRREPLDPGTLLFLASAEPGTGRASNPRYDRPYRYHHR